MKTRSMYLWVGGAAAVLVCACGGGRSDDTSATLVPATSAAQSRSVTGELPGAIVTVIFVPPDQSSGGVAVDFRVTVDTTLVVQRVSILQGIDTTATLVTDGVPDRDGSYRIAVAGAGALNLSATFVRITYADGDIVEFGLDGGAA